MRILLVENPREDLDETKRLLEADGFIVDAVNDAKLAVDFARDFDYVAGVFDLYLITPATRMGGLELIAMVRKLGKEFPILVLTMDSSVETEIMALSRGAKEYVFKCHKSEYLLVRLRNMISSPEGDNLLLRHGPITLSIRDGEVHVDGRRVHLTKRAFNLLEYLMTDRRVVTLEAIKHQLWEKEFEKIGNGKIYTLVHMLRKRLDPDGKLNPILSVRERGGYLLRDFTNEA